MTVAARDLVTAFDALSSAEREQVLAELLRRSLPDGDVPEASLDELAAEVFRSYDDQEAARAAP